MEFGHVQTLISIVLVVAAIVVAIVVDVLKKNNEHLRELTIELESRRDAEGRTHQVLASKIAKLEHTAAAAPPAPVAAAPEPVAAPASINATRAVPPSAMPKVEEAEEEAALAPAKRSEIGRNKMNRIQMDEEFGLKRPISSAALDVIAMGAQWAKTKGKNGGPKSKEKDPTLAKLGIAEGDPVPKELIEKLRKERAAQAAAEFGEPEPVAAESPMAAAPETNPEMAAFPPILLEEFDATPNGWGHEEPAKTVAAPAPVHVSPVPAPAVQPTVAQRDWRALMSAPRREAPAEPKLAPEPVVIESRFNFLSDAPAPMQRAIPETLEAAPPPKPAPVEQTLPSGFQDGYVLSRLVESRQPVSGLVVSVGANMPKSADPSFKQNLNKLIQSLIGPKDFAAQAGEGEFLMIFPGERGASAQQRLRQIAEQLWDFQLHSMGLFTIQFSWGGVEVRSESIEDAMASATERMQETRRTPKRPATEAPPLRRAV